MITITLTIQTFKKYPPPLYIYKVIDLGDNTYINKFARVERGTQNLSVSTGPQCLGIAMLEARYVSLCNGIAMLEAAYVSLCNHTLPSGER